MQRAAQYRDQAAQLRELAAAALPDHRTQLLVMADEFESLADSTAKAMS